MHWVHLLSGRPAVRIRSGTLDTEPKAWFYWVFGFFVFVERLASFYQPHSPWFLILKLYRKLFCKSFRVPNHHVYHKNCNHNLCYRHRKPNKISLGHRWQQHNQRSANHQPAADGNNKRRSRLHQGLKIIS